MSFSRFSRLFKFSFFSAPRLSLLALFSIYASYKLPFQSNSPHSNTKHEHSSAQNDTNPIFDFARYLADHKLVRFSSLENANRPYKAFYYDGIRKMLDCFSKYEVYAKELTIQKYDNKQFLHSSEKGENGIICLLFNSKEIAQGHKEITHGGLIATVLDHLMGRMSDLVADGARVATVNLNVNYKKPVEVGKDYLLEIKFEKIEKERKIFLRGKIINKNNEVCVESSALFLKVNWGTHIW